jgi:hypothetical protein
MLYAQKDSPKVIYKLPVKIDHGDTLGIYTMEDTKIDVTIDEATATKQKEWDRLVNGILVVYPYARECAYKIKEIDAETAKLDRRIDQKKLLRTKREELVKNYSSKLKELSNYQGELLIKLIYRETGRTSYDLIREYESGFTAGFWQTLSRLDKMNLKDTYDPSKDVLIEKAIHICGY